MTDRSPLFRPAAVQAKRPRALGEILLAQPLSFRLWTMASVAAGAVIVGFFAWGTYTEHSTLVGQLVPDLGVIRVYSPQYGTVEEKHVAEGDSVAYGDVLYALSSERLTSANGATHELIGRELGKRRRSLQEQIEKTRALERTDRESLQQMRRELTAEIEKLQGMIEGQQRRVDLAEHAAQRYAELHAQGFVSEQDLIGRQEVLLDQRSRLQSLERENSNVARQLTDIESQIEGVPLKYENQVAELERAVGATIQEETENEARRRLVIVAPEDGIATAVLAEVGQFVDASKPLVSIVPRGARLQAQLYGPSRSVGFVNVGDRVMLRYQAYPYQKFGHQEGTVAAVSRTAAPLGELSSLGSSDPAQGAEALYRITVDLEAESIEVYGEQRELQAGMMVEADVLQETRKLYEWVLEPLYTVTGKLH